ncbi:autotransporter-associated beta strand repeat-containing protein [uncultured Paracoccus sp.]|uniref:beta strand repeat-containing protein n=1 Tax=uncultured Paracoccus sp. TaxID=189685 RepID=UPI0025D56561|nr:autotransporter-associated beta strand repeat-containing protein [uncultured Paracoccus sp.]
MLPLAEGGLADPPVLPAGGDVRAGSAIISGSSGAMLVNQSSDRAIIDWQSFSVGRDSSVTFAMPGAGSAVLNRVSGAETSVIAGSVSGNGQVFLVNPNGIAVTSSGAVKVGGGFVASTLDVADGDFQTGKLKFAGRSQAVVSNAGAISAGHGGYVGLLSNGGIDNSGTISVPAGRIALGTGSAITLDPSGSGFMQILAPSTAPDGGAIRSGGSIRASGGRVEVRATSARKVVRDLVNLSGEVDVTSVRREGGAIILDGGGGSVKVTGRVKASSTRARGGKVKLGGQKVALSGARIEADGTSGGTVLVGGGRQGAAVADLTTADQVLIDREAVLSASGSQDRGGEVTVWSNNNTQFLGKITATGTRGNGGEAEVSSQGTFNFNGSVNLLSRYAEAGNLLLDPYDLTISTDPNTNSSGFTAEGSGANINTTTLETALGGANVTVSTGSSGTENGDITLLSPIAWSANTALSLSAAGSIYLNSTITKTGNSSSLILSADGAGGIQGSNSLLNNGLMQFYVNNPAASGTLSGTISGTGNLQKGGAGTLRLTGANSYSGFTSIEAGTLAIGGSGSLGSGSYAARLTTQTGANLVWTSSANQTFDQLWGAGTNSFAGTGTLTIRGNQPFTGTLNLNQSTTITGGTGIVQGGVGHAAAVNIGSTVTLTGVENSFVGQGGVTTHVTLNSGGRLFNPGTRSFHLGPLTLNGGELASGAVSGGALAFGSYALDSPVSVNANSTISALNIAAIATRFTVASGVTLSVPGTINHICNYGCDQGFTKAGDGTMVLSGTNSYTAATHIDGGVLTVASAGALGNVSPIFFGGGTLQYSSANQTDYSSRFQTSGGQAWRIDTNGQSVTFASALQGAGSSLTKSGMGTLTLAGANTYTGGTAVNAGTVDLAGSWNLGAGTATTVAAAGATLSGTGVITAGTMSHSGGGTVRLTGPNAIGTLGTSGTVDSFTLTNAQSLTMGSLDANGAVEVAALGASSDLTLAPGAAVSSTVSGTAVTLAAGRSFLNQSGANAVSTPNGRWLVYSAAPAGDVFSGLDSGNTGIWNTSYGTAVSATGNRYVFAIQPTLTAGSTSLSKTYGTNASSAVVGSYRVTGYDPGIVGAYLADSAATVLSGAPVVTSAGTTAGAAVGNYVINVASGSLAAANGYALSYSSAGTLRVNPAALTITGNAGSAIYDGTVHGNGYSVTGLVAGDTVTGVSGLASGRNAGSYGDALAGATGSGLSNYAISYVNGGLTVQRAALTVRGNTGSAVYDGTVHGNGYSVTGLVAGDTVTGVSGLASGRNAGSYGDALAGATGSGLSNYAISYVNGGLTVERAALTIMAKDALKHYDGSAWTGGVEIDYAGLQGTDTAASLQGSLTLDGSAFGAVDPGNYSITPSGLSSQNYAITFRDGTLHIVAPSERLATRPPMTEEMPGFHLRMFERNISQTRINASWARKNCPLDPTDKDSIQYSNALPFRKGHIYASAVCPYIR